MTHNGLNEKILTEFIHSIDKDIEVDVGIEYCTDITQRVIFIGTLPNSFTTNLQPYLYIDRGIKYHNHCSFNTWCLLHELGHIMSSDIYEDIDDELVIYQYERLINLHSDKSDYNIIKDYMDIQLEKDANDWAYKYLLNNKGKIKRLEVQLANANAQKEVS
jgi:hypothetical protein